MPELATAFTCLVEANTCPFQEQIHHPRSPGSIRLEQVYVAYSKGLIRLKQVMMTFYEEDFPPDSCGITLRSSAGFAVQ